MRSVSHGLPWGFKGSLLAWRLEPKKFKVARRAGWVKTAPKVTLFRHPADVE